MVRHRLALTTTCCLLSLAGVAQGEPLADQPGASPHPPAAEVWGDPEAAEAPQPGWTWFGMGYERRNRERNERIAEPLAAPDKMTGSSGNGRSGK